jgi:uncharacterized protein YndB with AHSA1/START domain
VKVNTTDEFFIGAPREQVQRALLQLGADARWWPGARARTDEGHLVLRAPVGRMFRPATKLTAEIANVRAPEGFTWFLRRGELKGRAEWWLERFKDGTIVHYYLDVERGDGARARRLSASLRRHRWAMRRGVNALKDSLERREHAGQV